jgi:hypothetical protein
MNRSSFIRNLDTSATRGLPSSMRDDLRGWRAIIVLATVAIVVGVALNWSWLVAAGIAPLLLSVLPCVAMCALGLCMSRMTGRSCSSSTNVPTPSTSPVSGTDESVTSKPQQKRRLTDA